MRVIKYFSTRVYTNTRKQLAFTRKQLAFTREQLAISRKQFVLNRELFRSAQVRMLVRGKSLTSHTR